MNFDYINRIKDLRKDSDLSQEELAKRLGVHTTTYARWEQNPKTIKLPNLIMLAEYYNVSIDYLAGLTNKPRSYKD